MVGLCNFSKKGSGVMRRVLLLPVVIIFLYLATFVYVDKVMQNCAPRLQTAPPLKLLQAVGGYLHQITAEIIFVKTGVFLGGANIKPDEHEMEISQNLSTAVLLYPDFIDPYYYTESFLAPISKQSAEAANTILEKGIDTYPHNFVFLFFHAFNYYRYLNDPLSAAKAFQKASTISGAPPMFAHLAAVFSASGGDIAAGLLMLKIMEKGETNSIAKKRYQVEIQDYDKALNVVKAISSYQKKHNAPPETLEDLVPHELNELPKLSKFFAFQWNGTKLSLTRPTRKKKLKEKMP